MYSVLRKVAISSGVLLLCPIANVQAQFVEKLDPVISRVDVAGALIAAAGRKIDEIAEDRLALVLADPSRQAKMSPLAVQQVKRLKAGAFGGTGDERSLQLMSWVNSDAQSFSAPAAGGELNVSLSFSPSYNVARLSWSNVFRDYNCQKTVYNSAPSWTIVGSSIQVKEEALYRVFRNNKLIATITGERAYEGAKQRDLRLLKVGPVKISLIGIIPGNPELSSPSSVPVLYDFDPYQGALGQSVSYRVEAHMAACAFLFDPAALPFTASGGVAPFTITSQVWLDSDGDSVPDFYPAPEVSLRRNIAATPGLTVATTPTALSFVANDMNVVRSTVLASVAGGQPPYTFKWLAVSERASVGVSNDTSNRASISVRPSAQCEIDRFEVRVIAQDSLGRANSSTVGGRIRSRPWTYGCP
jgi:hypothetical protein